MTAPHYISALVNGASATGQRWSIVLRPGCYGTCSITALRWRTPGSQPDGIALTLSITTHPSRRCRVDARPLLSCYQPNCTVWGHSITTSRLFGNFSPSLSLDTVSYILLDPSIITSHLTTPSPFGPTDSSWNNMVLQKCAVCYYFIPFSSFNSLTMHVFCNWTAFVRRHDYSQTVQLECIRLRLDAILSSPLHKLSRSSWPLTISQRDVIIEWPLYRLSNG